MERKIQNNFTPQISGTLEHTSHMAKIIKRARIWQVSLIIRLQDLKSVFGELHHKLMYEVLKHHHTPYHASNLSRKC